MKLSDMLRQSPKKDLDLIIFGEAHTDDAHMKKECALIRKHSPEYILSEGFDNAKPQETQKIIDLYKNTTLSKLAEKYNTNLVDIGLGKKIMKNINNDSNPMSIFGGIIPKRYKTLINTPLYKIHSDTLDNLNLMLGENYSENPQINEIQIKLSSAINTFNLVKINDVFKQNNGYLYETVAKSGAKLVGCDIDKSKLTTAEALGQGTLREETMGQRAVEYIGKRKTKNPVIMIIGGKHAKKTSEVFPILDAAEINYKILTPRHAKLNSYKDKYYNATI
jgi:hypothetical protein